VEENGHLRPTQETICLDHLTDPVLRRHVEHEAIALQCSFCDRRSTEPFAVPMDEIVEHVYKVATWLYEDFNNASYFAGEPFETPLDTLDVVADCVEGAFDDLVLDQVIDVIAGAFDYPESWFASGLQDQFAYGWDQFASTVKHQSRFIYLASSMRPGSDREPPALLARFLDGLLAYADKEARMLVTLDAGFKLFRGRMTDDLTALRTKIDAEPSTELGPAPAERAGAGRMNAQGIPLFYVADDLHTAVAEVALHSPYDDAVVGEFFTQRRLTILDLTKTPKMPSVFDHAHRERFMFTRFVDDFVGHITAPVILDGRQRIEYVPTQVVTEFLRWAPDRRIDGIAFPSRASKTGKNLVLFYGPGNAFRTEPPTEEELQSRGTERAIGWQNETTFVLPRNHITEHTVRRSVNVKVKPRRSSF
jgi:RES domain-containing protein